MRRIFSQIVVSMIWNYRSFLLGALVIGRRWRQTGFKLDLSLQHQWLVILSPLKEELICASVHPGWKVHDLAQQKLNLQGCPHILSLLLTSKQIWPAKSWLKMRKNVDLTIGIHCITNCAQSWQTQVSGNSGWPTFEGQKVTSRRRSVAHCATLLALLLLVVQTMTLLSSPPVAT